MKKIGIITYHCVDNYGAVLQAYSLQDTVKKISNLDVDIVDYRPIEITKNYSFSIIPKNKSVIKLISNLLSYPFKKQKNAKFKSFLSNHIKLSDNYYEGIWEEYDVLIAGSDQVWNPGITRLAPYYLNLPKSLAKKVSYAASIGKDNLNESELSYLSTAISLVDNVSVREESAVPIVAKALPNKSVTQVLDPVFLKPAEQWLEILPKTKRFSNYILIYIMEYNEELFKLAKKLSKQENKKIIIVSPNANIKTVLKSLKLPGKVLYTQGPIEFLDLIVNADYICTNSFHGTAFSIIFEKKFITVAHGSRNTRLESILDNLGILSQQLDSKACNAALEKDVATLFQYDNAMVVRKLDDLKERSLKFLVEAVK
ncbi:polysaccharide pyruvyl transferase family protein [Pseudoalteromonas sp. MMG006]|uniref:polysaccharide pyruvyl transferase family protein n=1 Tax=Pseudoalteromonas sp. MMG006 TaxID=2822683 RepID=UPI001B38647C|nr:polysaccharide pyruvyl transferase family protein [Pseudoalteromonas sp. MMG006]